VHATQVDCAEQMGLAPEHCPLLTHWTHAPAATQSWQGPARAPHTPSSVPLRQTPLSSQQPKGQESTLQGTLASPASTGGQLPGPHEQRCWVQVSPAEAQA